jgi:hypothetical protein
VSMAGTPAEYERMALKSIEKAAEDVSDTSYHLKRADIFAALANAAAIDAGRGASSGQRSAPSRSSGPRRRAEKADPKGDEDGANLPAVRAS